MAIILDADIIIRGEKGLFDLKGWLASRPADQFEIAGHGSGAYAPSVNNNPAPRYC